MALTECHRVVLLLMIMQSAGADALQAEWDESVDALHSSLSFVPPPHYRCVGGCLICSIPRAAIARSCANDRVRPDALLRRRSALQRQQHGDT